MYTQRVRECSERATPLIKAVQSSPTNGTLLQLLALERDIQTELENLRGFFAAVDEPHAP